MEKASQAYSGVTSSSAISGPLFMMAWKAARFTSVTR